MKQQTNYYLNRAFTLNFFITPIYVTYLLSQGLSFTEVSFLHVIRDLSIFACELPFGMLADWLGRKKLLYVSIGLAVLTLVLMVVSPQVGFFALGFACWGGAIAADSGTVSALMYETLDDTSEHQRLVSTSEVWRKAANSVTNLIGGWLYLINATLPFLASIGLLVIPFITALKMPNKQVKRVRKQIYFQQVKTQLGRADFLLPMVGISLLVSSLSLVFMYQQPVLLALGVEVEYFGLIFAGLLFVGMIGSYGLRHVPLASHAKPLLIGGGLLLSVGMVLMTPISSLGVVLLAMICLALLNGLVYPLKFIVINQLVSDEVRSSLLSVQSYCEFGIKASISLLVGVIADTFGLSSAIAVIAMLPLVAVSVFVFWQRKK